LGEQYKIKYDDSLKCWVIIDTTNNVQGLTGYETRVEAEARVHELKQASTRTKDALATSSRRSTIGLDEAAPVVFVDKVSSPVREVLIGKLKGKVKCSQCLTAFHEPEASSLRVTRLIGYDAKELSVALLCVICQHRGIFSFDGNPLIDAGLVK